jgi:hypothetical protein
VAHLATRTQLALTEAPEAAETSSQASELTSHELALQRLADEGPSYARRDAAFALADLCWRTGRLDDAAVRYREIAGQVDTEAIRRFCLRRAAPADGSG